MAKITPLADQILIKPEGKDGKEEVRASGIIIPSTASESSPAMGEVIAVGTSKLIEKRGIKAGDVVIYAKYSGTDIKIDGEEYVLVSIKDILAKVKQ